MNAAMSSEELTKGGFRLWLNPYGANTDNPLKYQLVETYNSYSCKRSVFDPNAMHPSQNVANLWWRPFPQNSVLSGGKL